MLLMAFISHHAFTVLSSRNFRVLNVFLLVILTRGLKINIITPDEKPDVFSIPKLVIMLLSRKKGSFSRTAIRHTPANLHES